MLTSEWWKRNLGGIMLTSFATLCIYALGQYISGAITREMKGYLPLTVWHQWAQEREEWRGKVDAELKASSVEMAKTRQENLLELRDVSKEIAKMGQTLVDLKQSFEHHEQIDADRLLRQERAKTATPP